MTAEIGILNKQAVALAADSAVTIRGTFGQKIYNHANKLFMLSNCHPVGIMIYGNAELTGVPWETIIKMYRVHSADKCFDYLEGYCTDFLEFLQTDPFSYFIQSRQEEDFFGITYNHLKRIRNKISQAIEEYIDHLSEEESSSQVKSEVVIDLIESFLEYELNALTHIPFLDGFTGQDVDVLLGQYERTIEKAINSVWVSFPMNENIIGKLQQIIGNYFNRDIFNDYSGLVIAGFGEKEIFPSMNSYIIECKVNGKVKLKLDKDKTQNLNNSNVTSSLVPFAQEDMVKTIASGVDPNIDGFSFHLLKSSMQDLAKELTAEIQTRLNYEEEELIVLEEKLNEITGDVFKSYIDQNFQYRKEHHSNPLVQTIEIMPKEELAVIAETLVNLTSFKRKISSESETVGGPVDVALITKGDGFVWIKRKHYFNAEINTHYFENKKGGRRV